MVLNNLDKSFMWCIRINSKYNLLYKDRDFMAELVSEEARKTITSYYFILHDILEFNLYSKVLIEGNKCSKENLVMMLKENTDCNISFKKISF